MKYTVSAHPLSENEKKEFGVFVSHSNDSDMFLKVCEAFEKAGISHLVDKQIEIGSLNFADEIKRLIDTSRFAVVVITEGALASSWVNFEIGLLSGEHKRIILFDPDNLIGKMPQKYHLDKLPVTHSTEELVNIVERAGYFSDLFVYDTPALSKEFFEQRVREYVEPVKFTLTLPGLADLNLEEYFFTALIINFGAYEAGYGGEGLCFQAQEECENCPVSLRKCAISADPDTDAFPECVTLNKITEHAIIRGNEITFILPLHKVCGTTFKIFAEIKDSKQCDRLFALLEDAGLSPSVSKSGNLQHIYVSVPDFVWDGIFRLKDEFGNNFLCPSVTENEIGD